MKTLLKFYFFFILVGFYKTQAQQQFALQGNATTVNTTTYRLTSDNGGQTGMITNLYPKDLTQNFEINFEVFLGSRNGSGADGIAFIFSKICNPNLVNGGGLGAANISNSIIIEFDTYDNGGGDFDIGNHHITIFKNGLMNSSNHIMDGVSQPVCARSGCGTIDNGNWYPVKIKWEYFSATSQKVSVFFFFFLRVTSTRNHIANSFQGNTKVFYSLSAATGAVSNLQQVRISDNSVINNVCSGSAVTLLAPELGSNYVWSNGGSTTFSNTFVPTTSGNITCTYKDFCNATRTITFNINLKPAIQTPTITTNSPICGVGNAVFTINGTAGTTINYTLDSVPSTSIIPASGNLIITKNNASSDVELKILQIGNSNCSASTNTSSTINVSSNPITSPINSN